jgi:hypothetical protein
MWISSTAPSSLGQGHRVLKVTSPLRDWSPNTDEEQKQVTGFTNTTKHFRSLEHQELVKSSNNNND